MKILSRRDFILSSGAICASAMTNYAFGQQKPFSSSKTGYAYDDSFSSFWNNSAETYLRAEWINARLKSSGVRDDLTLIQPYHNPMKYIEKIHTKEHIEMIERIPPWGGFTLTIGEAAKTAAGHALGAVKAVCDGTVRNAFCCIRPPGHHVQNSGELGYCCYANVVLAAKYARSEHNIGRILIIDWDFHQGNGTHGFICGDNDILFFETYNPPMYTTTCDDFNITGPDHSYSDDARRINIQMPSGSTNNDFVRIFESKLVPAAERFKPELVLVSCGFDLKKFDSHGTFEVTSNGISRLTRILRQIADTYANGRLVSMLEGGYVDTFRDKSIKGTAPTFSGLSQCAENHVKTLMTGDEHKETPYYSSITNISGHIQKKSNIGVSDGLPQDNGPWDITVTDLHGKIIRRIHHRQNIPLNMNNFKLSRGQYIISTTGKNGKSYRSIKVVR